MALAASTSARSAAPRACADALRRGVVAAPRAAAAKGHAPLSLHLSAPDRALAAACEGGAHSDEAALAAAAEAAIKAGANVETHGVNKWGQPPLSLASMRGHAGIVRLLLKAGANVKTADSIGHTPLVFAVMNGHQDVVDLLIAEGADVFVRDKYDLLPADWASRSHWPASLAIEEALRKAAAARGGGDAAGLQLHAAS